MTGPNYRPIVGSRSVRVDGSSEPREHRSQELKTLGSQGYPRQIGGARNIRCCLAGEPVESSPIQNISVGVRGVPVAPPLPYDRGAFGRLEYTLAACPRTSTHLDTISEHANLTIPAPLQATGDVSPTEQGVGC